MKIICRIIFFCLFVFALIQPTYGQSGQKRDKEQNEEKEEYQERKSNFEIGLNATTVLSSFVGNESLIEASDFPLMMRAGFNKFFLRVGLGINGSSREFFDNVSGIFRTNEIKEYFFKAGLELAFFTEKRWTAYTGVDGIYSLLNDKVTVESFDRVIIQNNIQRFGIGPILGIKYAINPRLYLHTEATLYGFVKYSSVTQEENNVEITLTETTDFSGSLQSPLFLYINYKL